MAIPVFSYPGELLHQAAIFDQKDFLKSLLQSGVQGDANCPDPRGLTPVHTAALHDSAQCLEELLCRWKGNPNAVTGDQDNNSTPIHLAARNGHIKCLKLLVDNGGDVSLKNKHGKNAREVALKEEHYDCADYLKHIEAMQRAAREEELSQELLIACTVGEFEKVQVLIDEVSPTNINRIFQGGYSLLYKASFGGHLDIVKLLLRRGADGSPHSFTGMSPLYVSCSQQHVEVARLLVQSMPLQVTVATKMEKQIPLHVAASMGNVAIVKILMQCPEEGDTPQKCNGIDVNSRTSSGMTPLHHAVPGGCVDVVKVLIEGKHKCIPPCRARAKLDINAQSIMGRTALHDAITVGHKEVVKLLLKGGADVNLAYNPDQVIYRDDHNDEISRVARRLAEDVRDKDKTPLAIACEHGNLDIVEILVNDGAVDVGSACVERASKAHHHALVHLLLSKGVNVDNEYKIPHSSRGGNHVEEAWRSESNSVCIIWNSMKLSSIHPQWIVDAAKRINPQVAAANVGLHPVLKTITRLDLSGNSLAKLPLIIFQLPSLRILNLSENALACLPSLHNGKVKPVNGNGMASVNVKKYHSCDNITDRIIEEEVEADFTYAESSWNCPHLEEIEIHHNSLTTLPTCVFQLPMLKFLNVSYNDIDSLPFGMWFAPVLKTLDLKGNYLKVLPLTKEVKKKLPKAIPKTNVKPRYMSKSRDDISKELIREHENETPVEKQPIKTKKEKGSTIKQDNPSQPSKPQHLKIFCHSKLWGKNGLEDLEDSSDEEEEIDLHKGHALLKLDLSNNQFLSIPKGIACLATNLQTLNLSNNNISRIDTLAYFPISLSSLDVSNNRLDSLDPQANDLPASSCYALVDGQRSGFGMSRGRGSMKGRVCRHLRHRTLPNLKRLDVNHNSIRDITFSTLHVHTSPVKSPTGSKSTAWFAGIDNKSNAVLYPSIQSLNVSGNPIADLPKDVGLLNKLGSLHISHTEITKLPAEIGLLSDLWDLQYVGLSLQDIEPSVLERKKTKDLVSYLRSVLERSKPYPCMKLMFVGVSNIGKTTLLNQLRLEGTGSYQSSPSTGWTERQRRRRDSSLGRSKKQEKNMSTVGVDVSDWTYPKRNSSEFFRGDARQPIKFSTWDFGGQREYYATHQCFLSHRSLYIVMWKVTDGEKGVNEIEPWLLNIQARAPDSPCIIVGTHYDMLTSEEKRSNYIPDLQQMIKDRYIAREYGGDIQNPRDRGLPRVLNRIEISSKTNYHLRELRHMIYNKAIEIKERGSRTPLLDTPIPESYMQVEEAVGKIRRDCYQDDQTPVMRSEHFRNAIQKELEKQGVRLRDLEELQQATKFLHDNGVLLHYDDPLLRDLYFLDPQWLCDMLAHVVTVRQVNPHINNGVMKLTDLSLIFRSENFPANLIKQYINLLSKFEVALQWSSEYLLVPSLLPDRQPISNQPIAPGVSPVVSRAMNMVAYTKTRVLRRQYVMSYVPSGFWPRLITRVIADEEVRDVVRCCCQLVMEGEAVDGDKDKLASVAQPDWSCWKTGVELSCFGVKMLRICDLEGYPYYGSPDGMFNHLQYRNEKHDPTSYSTIAIIAPCVNILMEKFVQKKKVSRRRSTRNSARHGDDDDDNAESKNVIGFRVKSVTDVGIQLAARLLAIVVEHFDTLITDWFPGLDALTVHGYRLVSRIIPCPKCITEISGVDDVEPEGEGVPYTQQNDSGAHLTTDGSSTNASPWPSPVHGAVTPDIRRETTPSPVNCKKSNSLGSNTSELTPDTTGEFPMSPPYIQVQDNSNRFTFKSVSSGLGTNESSSYSDHSSDSADELDTDGSEEPSTPQARKGKNFNKNMIGSTESDRSRGSDEYNRRDSRASNSSSERKFGSQTDSQRSKGSTESTSSFNRSGRYGSFRRRPTENEKPIYAFEFEECVLSAYNSEPIKCEDHGLLNLREVAPDVMFEDIAPDLAIHPGNLVRGKFLGKGTFGSVFRGELKDAAGDSDSVAMKMPLNNEVGEDAKPEERQAAEAAKRALKDNPMMALNDAYRTVRQEISILLPLQHPNIVSLKGFCLSPLCMVLEFAPLGALDRLLYNFKRAGARLNPYVVQKCIVQCASALKYLHKHHIIYRDLKSENILAWCFPLPHSADQAAHEVVIKLADYGISRTAAMAGIKGLGGTPGFMAPEIEKYVGKECYTDKVDTFSFGMYIYELITLHQPFYDLSPAQVKQMIVEGQRPPLSPKDRKAPVYAMDLMAWCWEQDSDKRPTSAHVYALASSPEFARLLDVLTFDKQLTINCAVNAGSRVNSGCGADGISSVGNEVWLCRSELNNGMGTSKINVMKYTGGRFSHKEELSVSKGSVRVACSVGSTVWLGTESGTLHVYCSITYRELCKGVIKRAKYILNMVHIPRCNWVLVALADGSILAYNDNICNHYYYSDPGSQTATQELLPSRGYPGNGNPIHCIASVPIIYPRIVEPSNDDGTRGSPEPTEDYICEVWCGQEKGEITVLDGEELQKISTMPAEDSDSDVTILKEQSVSHLVTCRTFKSTIKSEEPVAKSVWVALYPGTRVFRWDAQEKRTVKSVDCSLYKPKFDMPKSGKSSLQRSGGIRHSQLSAVRAQVNSLLAVDKELYIGTSWGCILVCNNITLNVCSVIRCHEETVSYLLPIVSTSVGTQSNTNNSLVMSCGRGYRNIGASLHGNNPYPSLSQTRRGGKPLGKREAAILVWLADSWEG